MLTSVIMKGSIAFYSKLFVLRLQKTINKLTAAVTGPIPWATSI